MEKFYLIFKITVCSQAIECNIATLMISKALRLLHSNKDLLKKLMQFRIEDKTLLKHYNF